jgi:hypothetical protein
LSCSQTPLRVIFVFQQFFFSFFQLRPILAVLIFGYLDFSEGIKHRHDVDVFVFVDSIKIFLNDGCLISDHSSKSCRTNTPDCGSALSLYHTDMTMSSLYLTQRLY